MSFCTDCPLFDEDNYCVHILARESYNLINRQRAEIKKLKNDIEEANIIERENEIQSIEENKENAKMFLQAIKTVKSEAIKEFADRLKGVAYDFRFGERGTQKMIYANDIDNLVKEMTEENQIENEFNYTKMYKAICDLTAEDVKEIQHGKWIDIPFGCSPSEHGSYDGRTKCSVCGFVMSRLYYKYCPCCGARMDGETNEI